MVDVDDARRRQRADFPAELVVVVEQVLVLHLARADYKQRRGTVPIRATGTLQAPKLQLRRTTMLAVEWMVEDQDVRLVESETQLGADLEIVGDDARVHRH